ncbi:glycosyltransferase family 2 protein [Beduinella massiliensis]|uniref:glycosyltransferase family 2 protein n=1 Tax=Beduinella massiliensis TaxID=1852363 RepID=UPI0031F85B6B
MEQRKQDVEILMTTYNGERYLREQIDSILGQSYKGWHLLISDDGSTDHTPDIIEEYQARYPQQISRVRLGKRFGNAREHFFALMQASTAGIVFFCDQDDVWLPEKMERTLRAMSDAQQMYGKEVPLLAYTDVTPVNERFEVISPSLMQMQQQNPNAVDYRNILFQNIVTGCTSAANRALIELAARCTDITSTVMHDWWIALVAARFGKLAYVDDCTLLYRQHIGNSVGAQDVRSLWYIWYKITHFRAFRKIVCTKKRQAAVFLKTYEKCLPKDDKRLLQDFSAEHSSLVFKLNYLKWISSSKRKIGFMMRW